MFEEKETHTPPLLRYIQDSLHSEALANYLSPSDTMRLILALSAQRQALIKKLSKKISLPWKQYRLHYPYVLYKGQKQYQQFSYYVLRDFYILTHFHQKTLRQGFETNCRGNLDAYAKQLFASTLLSVTTNSDSTSAWSQLVAAVSLWNLANYRSDYQRLAERLQQINQDSLPTEIPHQISRIDTLLKEQTKLVVTFNPDRLNLNKETHYKSFFELRNRFDTQEDTEEYTNRRVGSEAILYGAIDPSILQRFIIDATSHPCYGTLQFQNQIQPITEYGESFFILKDPIKQNAIALFGAPLTKLLVTNQITTPVHLNQSLAPLALQLPDSLLKDCLDSKGDDGPALYDFQFQDEKSDYIEVQFPANLRLDSPQNIQHLHFEFSENMLSNEKIASTIESGILLTLGKNPYENNEFAQASKTNTMEAFLIATVADYIYQTALFLGETTRDYLHFSIDKTCLTFTFRVTNNAPQFHQAQAAGLLYLMGARRYFEKNSPIDFAYENFDYRIPLNGQSLQEGSIFDHDAYTYEYASLRKLLNIFLFRIITINTISFNNDIYVVKHKKLHTLTGKGATDEAMLTNTEDLSTLITGVKKDKKYEVKTNWLYDGILIELPTTDFELPELIILVGNAKTAIEHQGCYIYIPLSISQYLKELSEERATYQACIIHDDTSFDDYGDLLLANRFGYTTPGGHNNDPYNWIGAYSDIEFGQFKFDKAALENFICNKTRIGRTQNPDTAYYLCDASDIRNIKEDTSEFKEGSLSRFPVYQLGNLEAGQISSIARHFGIEVKEYLDTFGFALALRPVPAILVYLSYYEKLIADLIIEIIKKATLADNPTCTVQIESTIKEKKLKGKTYHVPTMNFGEITIHVEPEHKSRIINYLLHFDKFAKKIHHLSDDIILTKINPYYLHSTIKKHYALLNHLTFIEQQLSDLRKNEVYLIQFFSAKTLRDVFYETLLLKENCISLEDSLDDQGLRLFTLVIKGFMKHLDELVNYDEFSEAELAEDEDSKKYVLVINRWLHTLWPPKNISVYTNTVKTTQIDVAEFLEYNPFLTPALFKPKTQERMYEPDEEKWKDAASNYNYGYF